LHVGLCRFVLCEVGTVAAGLRTAIYSKRAYQSVITVYLLPKYA